jgi:RNA polymerase sigma factor (sigma-70 family)
VRNVTELEQQFETERTTLYKTCFRILGSRSEAEDAVQQTWLRLARADVSDVENLAHWLTTVAVRICLDTLRSRRARREQHGVDEVTREGVEPRQGADERLILSDSVAAALVVVFEKLTPPERVALLFHEMFELSFDELAPYVCRSPTAARQLASRARRRARTASFDGSGKVGRSADVVQSFLAVSQTGELAKLLSLLCPEAMRHTVADASSSVASARLAQPAIVDGAAGVLWGGVSHGVAMQFVVQDERIVDVERKAATDVRVISQPRRARTDQ